MAKSGFGLRKIRNGAWVITYGGQDIGMLVKIKKPRSVTYRATMRGSATHLMDEFWKWFVRIGIKFVG